MVTHINLFLGTQIGDTFVTSYKVIKISCKHRKLLQYVASYVKK